MSWRELQNQVKQLAGTPETWELSQAEGPVFFDEDGEPQFAHVVLLVDADGIVVANQTLEEAGDADLLAAFIMMACLSPHDGEPRRPASVTVADRELAAGLAQELGSMGLSVKHGMTPAASFVVEQLLEHLELGPQYVPVGALDGTPDDKVRAYFKAAEEFYLARPWEAIDAEKFVGVSLEGKPWRYLSIMGAGGEEFGFTVYDSWLDACRLAYSHMSMGDADEPNPLRVMDAIESVSLLEWDLASPDDAAVIHRLGIRTTWKDQYALVQRVGQFGPEEPINSLDEYTAVMQVLTQRVNRTRGGKVTRITTQVETDFGPLEVMYPAKGTEDAPEDEYYELAFNVTVSRRAGSLGAVAPVEQVGVHVLTPAAAKWPQVIKAVRQKLRDSGYSDPYLDQLIDPILENVLWFGHGSAVEPSPTVAQLAEDVPMVMVNSGRHGAQVWFERIDRPAEDGISVTLIEGDDE